MGKRFRVTLTNEERDDLSKLIGSGKAAARTLTHARILLKADESDDSPKWTDAKISEALDVGLSTIWRVRQCFFVEEGIDAALHRRRPSKHRQRLLDGVAEAHLIALTCSTPPAGYERWTLRLLAGKMVELEYVDAVSHETVRQVSKKTNSSRG